MSNVGNYFNVTQVCMQVLIQFSPHISVGGNFLWTSKNADAAKLLQHKPSNFVIAVGLKSKQPFQADQYTQFLKVN